MRPSDESCGLLSIAVVVVAFEVSLTFCVQKAVLKVVVAVVVSAIDVVAAVVAGPFAILLIRSAGSVVVTAVVSTSEYFA
jgi:hypothetical protein